MADQLKMHISRQIGSRLLNLLLVLNIARMSSWLNFLSRKVELSMFKAPDMKKQMQGDKNPDRRREHPGLLLHNVAQA